MGESVSFCAVLESLSADRKLKLHRLHGSACKLTLSIPKNRLQREGQDGEEGG